MPKASKKSHAHKRLSNKTKKTKQNVLPGFVAFTKHVLLTLTVQRSTYIRLTLLLFAALFITTGLSQQSLYKELADGTQVLSEEIAAGFGGILFELVTIFVSVVSGTLSSAYSESQQLYVVLFYLLMWLTVVWLIRHQLAGDRTTMRDGLYSAGAPLIPTLLVGVVFLVQLLPIALLTALISNLTASGILYGFWLIPAVLVYVVAFATTIYWLSGTLFAAVVATVPGTYPVEALRKSKMIVAGYQLLLIKRIVWLVGLNIIVFFLGSIPVVLLDILLGYSLSGFVVAWLLLISSALMTYSSAYLFLLYRGIIDERTK